MRIRFAEENDISWLIAQLKLFSAFYGSQHALFGDEEYATKYISNLIYNHVVLIADDNEPVGFIAGYVSNHPYNPQITVLTETFWWVDEAHRGGTAGARLLKAFKEWAETNNIKWVLMSLIEGRSPIKEESLTKRGYRLHEKSFLMELGV